MTDILITDSSGNTVGTITWDEINNQVVINSTEGINLIAANNGDIATTPSGSGTTVINGLHFPRVDGTFGQLLTTNGAGTLSFITLPDTVVTSLNDLSDVSFPNGQDQGWILTYSVADSSWIAVQPPEFDLTLTDLNDVTIVNPVESDVLSYNSLTQMWENVPPTSSTSTTLGDLQDVTLTNVQLNQGITWNGTFWVNTDLATGTGNVESVFGRTGIITAEAADYGAFYANLASGALADTSLQPGDNITELTNDAGYITLAQVPADAVTNVFGRTGVVTAESGDYASFYAPIIHTHTVNDITDLTTYYYDKTTTNSLLSNKANLVTGTVGNFVELDGTGQLRDSLSNYSSFADWQQGVLADTALQPGNNISLLTNDSGYITAADIPTAISTIPANSLIIPQNTAFVYCRNMEVIASVEINNLAIEVYNLINNQWQVVYTDLSTNIAAMPILSTNGRCITVSSGETIHTHRETLTGWTVLPIQNITGLQSIIEVTEVDDYERMLYQTSTGFYTSDLINDVWSNFRFVASGGKTSLAVYGNFLVNWTLSKADVYQLIGGVWTLHHSYTSGGYGNVTVRFDGSMILHGYPPNMAIETPTTITRAISFVQNSGVVQASVDFSKLLVVGNSSIQQFTYDNQSIVIDFILDTPILLTSGGINSYSVSFAGDQVIATTAGNTAQIVTFKLAQSATPSDAVLTVFGRTGSVVAQSGDYSAYYAPVSKGLLADTALQPNDNISELNNDSGYITAADIPADPNTTAANVSYDNTTSNLTATNVQAALDEIDTAVDLNTAARHTHLNKSVLDGITAAGSGQIITIQERTDLATAIQPGDNITQLTNNAGYITAAQVPADAVPSVFGRTGAITAEESDYSSYYAPIEATSYAIDTVQAVATPSSVNIASGGFLTYTATGANTWNFTVPSTTGKAIGWTLELTNGGLGAQTFTGVTWATGTAPTLVASGLNVLVFTKNNVTGVIRGYVAV